MEYIAREDPDAAAKMYARIRERVDALAKRPELGRPGRVLGTREFMIGGYPYIIPYRIRGDELQVLCVFYTNRKPPETW